MPALSGQLFSGGEFSIQDRGFVAVALQPVSGPFASTYATGDKVMFTTVDSSPQENSEASSSAFPQTVAAELYRARADVILAAFDAEFISPEQSITWLLAAESGEFPVAEIRAALLAARPGTTKRSTKLTNLLGRLSRLGDAK